VTVDVNTSVAPGECGALCLGREIGEIDRA
jgi:hypothetical protein